MCCRVVNIEVQKQEQQYIIVNGGYWRDVVCYSRRWSALLRNLSVKSQTPYVDEAIATFTALE